MPRAIPPGLPFDERPAISPIPALVELVRRQGHRVVWSSGRPWRHHKLGYWAPVPFIDPLSVDQLVFPTCQALGIRALVADPSLATNRSRQGLVRQLPAFSAEHLDRDRRRCVRSALSRFEYRLLTSPDALLEDGWRVARSAVRCQQHPLEPSEETYRQAVIDLYEAFRPAVVGAFIDGRLCGYMTSSATGRTVTLDKLYIAKPWRTAHVGSGLYWITLLMWADVSGVEQAALGGTGPGLEGVDAFKRSFGVEFFDLPAISRARKLVGVALRMALPRTHRRYA